MDNVPSAIRLIPIKSYASMPPPLPALIRATEYRLPATAIGSDFTYGTECPCVPPRPNPPRNAERSLADLRSESICFERYGRMSPNVSRKRAWPLQPVERPVSGGWDLIQNV